MTTLKICRSLDVEEILETTVSEVRQLLAVERVAIYQFEPDDRGSVVIESAAEAIPSMLGQTIYDPCLSQHYLDAFSNDRFQSTEDIYASELSPCHVDFLARFGIRANLVFPIMQTPGLTFEKGVSVKSSKIWGLLSIQQCSAPRQWKPSEVDFLQKLAIYVELAIHQAELLDAAKSAWLARQQAESEVLRINAEFEGCMSHRAAQLERINQNLRQEILEHKSIERKLFAEKELAQITLEAIGDAVITTDAKGDIQYFNAVAEQLTGWKTHEVKGLPLTDVFNIVNEITRRTVENPLHQVLRSGQIANLAQNTILIARDGTEYPIEDSAAPIRASNGEIIGVVLVFHDVTQSRYLARQLSWQANHDDLTGLFNRRTFERQLTDAIVGARSQKQNHVLCFLDLDQFKAVNDTCGHAAGDELLCQVTRLFQERVRLTDTLARLGGDEFGLLLHQCSLAQAEQVAESLRQRIQEFEFIWQGKVFTIGVSIGLAEINADSQNLNTVLSAADAACYAAKERGRNCIYVYHSNDLKLVQHRNEIQWISKIDRALREDRFQLYFQKIAPVMKGTETDRYEILLRLVDEFGELVLPMAFIPAAERYHLIPAIDRWVIRSFFSQYGKYRQEFIDRGCAERNGLYTINLSGGSVNSGEFLEFLEDQFAEYNIPPQNICFEITETTAIANLDQAALLIHSLKKLGCRFALDDFGSGMSSLAYLKKLPVDYLKIDGGFIKDIDNDRIDYAMVDSFNRLSHLMGIQTIAECVERESVLKQLREIGVDYAQGFCIDKPSPLAFA
ncbi:EAL domain-containing protein [Altericista sp. CCNU0014]|uniref:EAL domain-containing protein n=1 Tax=Altericista sp. CCNU0014 TaxID=3082949 RepID=UPI003850FBFF